MLDRSHDLAASLIDRAPVTMTTLFLALAISMTPSGAAEFDRLMIMSVPLS